MPSGPLTPSRSIGGSTCFERLALRVAFCVLSIDAALAITSIDTSFVSKSVVFFFSADSKGQVSASPQVATGFLVAVPDKTARKQYYFLVTARHVVDPLW